MNATELLSKLRELVHCWPSCNSRWKDNKPCDCGAREMYEIIDRLMSLERWDA